MPPQFASRLQEIKDQLKELTHEAQQILQQHASPFNYQRAKAYWIPSIKTALDHDHDFLGDCPCTLQDSIDSLL